MIDKKRDSNCETKPLPYPTGDTVEWFSDNLGSCAEKELFGIDAFQNVGHLDIEKLYKDGKLDLNDTPITSEWVEAEDWEMFMCG